ncbi:AMIN domain-containing protein [Sulfurimonas sp. SAG-AH-194-I05]|nr:AMIN domain-containing protein [Sulfurimonas sp. SAG-AH-194-I05]MDF1875702.1 AMIN domain-containing protein [Sulfurimonas sp. SAG-AH-194-I05]
MIKILLSAVVISLCLDARENPFFPTNGEVDLPFTTNANQSVAKLQRVSVSVPKHARIIKKVTVEYKNLDGSLEERSIELNNAIDWHLPVFISQSYLDESTNGKEPKKKIQESKKDAFLEVLQMQHSTFSIQNKTMKIQTKDKLLRYFLIAQPHRIVMDFKRDSTMQSYEKIIKDSVFDKIRIGNHKGYYRVVVELDGYYRFTLKKLSDGCLISLQ